MTDEVAACRLSEDLTVGAAWCRRCYRYKLGVCHPTPKKLVRYGKKTSRSRKETWITEGDAGGGDWPIYEGRNV